MSACVEKTLSILVCIENAMCEMSYEQQPIDDDLEQEFELCVIGAGIAGLNALAVAREFLGKDAKVALIDRNPQAGGMWNNAYGFVRLHQPHRMFTAGDIRWTINKPDHYLASGAEVLDHLSHCLQVIKQDLDLTELWECDVERIHDDDTLGDRPVSVVINQRGHKTSLKAERVIDAKGLNIPPAKPLGLSSESIISTTPERLLPELDARPDAPIYVIGGGKTGMDTMLTISDHGGERSVFHLVGKGTAFTDRGAFFPTGVSRFWGRVVGLEAFSDIAQRFKGYNEDDVFDHFRQHYSISPYDRSERHMFGVMSVEECQRIRARTQDVIYDYLSDIVDTADGPQIRFRGGDLREIEPGAIIVNCTGYVFREARSPAKLLSQSGRVLTVSSRAAVNFLPSMSAYFLSHLFFRDLITSTPLQVLDIDAMMSGNRKMLQMAVTTQSVLNALVIMDVLPMSVLRKCGADMDRWHPIYRRAPALASLLSKKKRLTKHFQESLRIIESRHRDSLRAAQSVQE